MTELPRWASEMRDLFRSGSAAQMSVIGPVSLVFLGAWLLGEPITAVQLIGTAVVLSGVLLLTRPGANSVPVANFPADTDPREETRG